jgi:hypothetical protein|tara:strand:+ start:332 stop:1123 length:792 start_codon:yes stop_codon:yes gene_type:complete
MSGVTKLDKGVVKRGVISSDKHFPLADPKAISCFVQAINIIKPDFYVDIGDVGEWESVSHWQWKKKKRPPLEYQLPYVKKEIEEVNECMDEIDEVLDKSNCKEKYMCQGNHDDWLDRFYEENPYVEWVKFEKACKLKERGFKYYPTGEYLKIGKLHYYHGHHFAGVHHTRNHLLRLGANVMYGHFHDLQQCSVTHLDGVKSAWSIGCMKKMAAKANSWLMNRRHNWSHAFAVVDYFDDGFFTVHIVQIIDGKTSLWGELIRSK